MAVRRYDIFSSNIFCVRHTVKNSEMPGREILYLQAARSCSNFYTNINEMPKHFSLTFFAAKGAIYHVAIATVTFHLQE